LYTTRREKKYELNAGTCKSIFFSCGSKPVLFQIVIGDSDLECVDAINDFGGITFVDHIELIVSKSPRLIQGSSMTLMRIRDVLCDFCPARFGVSIVRVVTSS
jgi:hypothetical protein